MAANAGHGAKWSLSIKVGADTPLWLYPSHTPPVCNASAVPNEQGPGSGNLHPFQFNWISTYGSEYNANTVQCIPIPWDTNYQTALNTFIQNVYTHITGLVGGTSQLDHVVVTGINFNTQENTQPHCITAGCGWDGVSTDVSNWQTLIHGLNAGCNATGTPNSTCTTEYNARINSAYNTIIGYWGTDFPSTHLASMFVETPNNAFPFNTTGPTLGLDLLNELASYPSYPSTRSIVMNNAAQVVLTPPPPSAGLDPSILCYQNPLGSGCPAGQLSSPIAFQEVSAVTGYPTYDSCSDLTSVLLSTAATDNSLYMETYPYDITNCGL